MLFHQLGEVLLGNIWPWLAFDQQTQSRPQSDADPPPLAQCGIILGNKIDFRALSMYRANGI